jgi:PHD/YefM family antitoxin component YafN of YafNO toxin-antitoxin module
MKTLTLKEAQALYNILTEAQTTQEPVLVERDGKPIGVFVPMAEYEAFRVWRESEHDHQQASTRNEAFQREVAAFERMKPELLKTHLGQAVAVYHGEIVAVGATKQQVYEQVTANFGEAPVFIHVVEDRPRVYKMPYRKVIR